MSQQTLEFLSDERVEPSLLESRYPEIIASVGSIDSYDSIVSVGSIASVASIDSVDLSAAEDSLAVEYSRDSEYSLGLEIFGDSENSSFVQEIEVDSLTGVPTDSTAYARSPRPPRRTTALLEPQLGITKFSYNHLAQVTATVRVTLSPGVRFFIEEDLVDITLQASVW